MPNHNEKELEAALAAIMHEIVMIHAVWDLLVGLYGTSRKRVDFIMRRAADFFGTIEDPLIDYVTLAIVKLLDLPHSQRRREENLSLRKIVTIIKKMNRRELCKELYTSIGRLEKLCETLIANRDKRIAHFDYKTHVEPEANMLPSITRTPIDKALKEVTLFIDKAWQVLTYTGYAFDPQGAERSTAIIRTRLAQSARYEELLDEDTIPKPDLGLAKYSTI
jgi:hypothetical protein